MQCSICCVRTLLWTQRLELRAGDLLALCHCKPGCHAVPYFLIVVFSFCQDISGVDYAAICNNAAETLYKQGRCSEVSGTMLLRPVYALSANGAHFFVVNARKSVCMHACLGVGEFQRAVELFEAAYRELLDVCNSNASDAIETIVVTEPGQPGSLEMALTLRNLALALSKCERFKDAITCMFQAVKISVARSVRRVSAVSSGTATARELEAFDRLALVLSRTLC